MFRSMIPLVLFLAAILGEARAEPPLKVGRLRGRRLAADGQPAGL